MPPEGSRWWFPYAWAVGIYLLCTAALMAVAGPGRLLEHTPYNHYALLADAWLHGRQDLPEGPPEYAGWNDFAVFEGKTFISFPPFPAVLALPFVALAGGPERFLDGLFFIALGGIAPAVLFLVLERLREAGRSPRTARENVGLALLFAFGTVYFSTAAQGTVWFAAHVVGVASAAFFLLFAIDVRSPRRAAMAGLALGCAWMTRPTMLLMAPLLVAEAWRAVCERAEPPAERRGGIRGFRPAAHAPELARLLGAFGAPIVGIFALMAWMNWARFHDPSPFAFGHEYLKIFWQFRFPRWGLFGYHYLAKNLGAALTALPWSAPGRPLVVSHHGLALWFTSPFFLWLLWPTREAGRTMLHRALALSAALPAGMDLLYQNTGWQQFGYRFSNDYALVLFLLLAIGGRRFGPLFRLAAAWALAWNLFGAVTYGRHEYLRFYDSDAAYMHPPD